MGDFHGEATGILENRHLQLEYLLDAPRIVGFAPVGKPNIFADLGLKPLATPHGDFYFRGGHRLWHSPEAMPRTYIPDNAGAVVTKLEDGISIEQPAERWTQIAKRLDIRLDPEHARVHVRHELRNDGAWTVELAAWALSMCRPGGVGIFPQPVGNVDAAGLLSNRQLALWPYASATDPRFQLDDEFVLVKGDPRVPAFKFGYFNRHGWIGYWLDGTLLVKRFELSGDAAAYPDGGCNVESYCNDQFLELETLSPLTKLEPGGSLVHTEVWEIYDQLVADLIPGQVKSAIDSMFG